MNNTAQALNLELHSTTGIVNSCIQAAIDNGASDLHFEPGFDYYRIRMRVDGILHEVATPELSLAPQISNRIKVQSNLNISETRLHQDGYLKVINNFDNINCRVSICPGINGEKIVIRLLNNYNKILKLDQLGLHSHQLSQVIKVLSQPQGLILITGPTGSGKTISLYSILKYLNPNNKNIITCEDPVEIELPGIHQIQIQDKINLSFARSLRAILRQDPDIIMIGEIRDLETAEIAIQAAETGHLVLASLHTKTATHAISRLKNLGIPEYYLRDNISMAIAQRLLRRICTYCNGKDYSVCSNCNNTGFKGRLGVFEVISDINNNNPQETLWHNAQKLVKNNLTTQEEVKRVIGNNDVPSKI